MIHIFFASDNNYSRHYTVTIASVLANAGENDEFSFYILDAGISEEAKKKTETLKKIKDFTIEYIKVDKSLFKDCLVKGTYVSLATYYRYLIPKIKPGLKKCIYLDCDIIVNGSLSDLWNTDLKGYYAGVVEDFWAAAKDRRIEYGLKSYFNAGVLLINNEEWIKDDISSRLFKNTSDYRDKIRWEDNDVLNMTFGDKILYLHPKYNCQNNVFEGMYVERYTDWEMDTARNNPVIIHYTGADKPWRKKGGNLPNNKCTSPYRSLYFKYLKMTPYGKETGIIDKIKYFIYRTENFARSDVKIIKTYFFGIPFLRKKIHNYTETLYFLGLKIRTKINIFDVKKFFQAHDAIMRQELININEKLNKLFDMMKKG